MREFLGTQVLPLEQTPFPLTLLSKLGIGINDFLCLLTMVSSTAHTAKQPEPQKSSPPKTRHPTKAKTLSVKARA